jgi:hypothetical protein
MTNSAFTEYQRELINHSRPYENILFSVNHDPALSIDEREQLYKLVPMIIGG